MKKLIKFLLVIVVLLLNALPIQAGVELWASNGYEGTISRFDGITGQIIDTIDYDEFGGLALAPDGSVYVKAGRSAILHYNSSGEYIDALIGDELGDIGRIEFGSDGYLYTESRFFGDEIFRYDVSTGRQIDVFITSDGEYGFAFGPDDNIYRHRGNEIVRYDGETGAFMDVFFERGEIGTDLTFGPDGNLYFANPYEGHIFCHDGITGEYMGVFASGVELNPRVPYLTFTFGPDGNLYTNSIYGDGYAIFRYNGTTGEFMDVFASEERYGNAPVDLLFVPEPTTIVLFSLGGLALLRKRKK